MSKPLSPQQKKELSEKTKGYSSELYQKIQDNIKLIADTVLLRPNIITTTSSGILIGEPKVAPIADIIAVGPECKTAKAGMKAYINFVSVGSITMWRLDIDGKLFVQLKESQLIGVYEGCNFLEEDVTENPEIKPGGDLAYTSQLIKPGDALN